MKRKEIFHPEFIKIMKEYNELKETLSNVLSLFDNNYRHLADYCIFLIKNNFIEFKEQFYIFLLMMEND